MQLLTVIGIGIDTHQEPMVYMRADCEVCKAEGFIASTRMGLEIENRILIATLNVVDESALSLGHIGLFRIALQRSQTHAGDRVRVTHAPPVKSFGSVRKKTFGRKLNEQEISNIVGDISEFHFSSIEIASFLSVCAGGRLDIDEIISLTRAMVACGKHCFGGLTGIRATPPVVSISLTPNHELMKYSAPAHNPSKLN